MAVVCYADNAAICRDDTHVYTNKKGVCKCYYFAEKADWVKKKSINRHDSSYIY